MYLGGNSPGYLCRGSMAPCVATDEAEGGDASQEQEQMRRTGRAKEGKVLEGVSIGADDQGGFCRGHGLVCEIAKARGFLCKNMLRTRQSLPGVPRVQFRVVLYEFVTTVKLED